jgi:hypothetical protein
VVAPYREGVPTPRQNGPFKKECKCLESCNFLLLREGRRDRPSEFPWRVGTGPVKIKSCNKSVDKLGNEVIVADARKVRLIGETDGKTNRFDAQTLARLARIDPQLLAPVKPRSAQAQADLTVIQARSGVAVWRSLKVRRLSMPQKGTAVRIVGTHHVRSRCSVRIRPA